MTNVENVPAIFNWVKARARCNPKRVFDDLIGVMKSDIASAEEDGVDCAVECRPVCERMFEFKAQLPPRGVHTTYILVELDKDIIVIYRDKRTPNQVILEAKPYLSDSGDCLLEIEDKSYRLWQVSRRVLEDLFF